MLERDDLLRISQEHDVMPRLNPNGSPIPSPEVKRKTKTTEGNDTNPESHKEHDFVPLATMGKSKTLPRRTNPFRSRKKLEKLASASMIAENVEDLQISNNPPSQPVRSRADCTSVPVKPNVMQAYL